MADQRLPIVNSDDGTWGAILREYLLKEHYNGDANLTPGTSTNGGHQKITIRPGTTAAGTAPLKFTSGSLMTTAEPGAMEFSGDTYYLTQTTGAARKKIAFQEDVTAALSSISADTITDGTTNKAYTATDKTKLAGIAAGATKGLDLTIGAIYPTASFTLATREYAILDGSQTLTVSLPASPAHGDLVGLFVWGDGGDITLDGNGSAVVLPGNGSYPLVGPTSQTLVQSLWQYDAGQACWVNASFGMAAEVRTIGGAGTTGRVVMAAETQSDGRVALGLGTAAVMTGPAGDIVGTTDAQALTNKNLTSGTNTFPTFNQSTTGSAATLTTSRTFQTNLASTTAVGFNGSANNVHGVTGTLPLANGGTGQTTQQSAINALTGTQSAGKYLRSDGTNATLAAIQAGDIPVLNQSTTGSAATLTTSRTFQTNLASTAATSFNGSANVTPGVTGTLPVANGGTGATTFTSGYVLQGNATSPVTATKAAPSGAFVGTTDAQTLTSKWLQPRIVIPTVASTYTIDVTATDQYNIINQNANISSITTTGTPVDGQKIMIRIKSDGSARTVTWGSIFMSSGVAGLLNTTVAGKTHHIALIYDSTAAKFICLACDVNGY